MSRDTEKPHTLIEFWNKTTGEHWIDAASYERLKKELAELKDTPGGKRLYSALAQITHLTEQVERLKSEQVGHFALIEGQAERIETLRAELGQSQQNKFMFEDLLAQNDKLRSDLALAVEALESLEGEIEHTPECMASSEDCFCRNQIPTDALKKIKGKS